MGISIQPDSLMILFTVALVLGTTIAGALIANAIAELMGWTR